MKETYIEQINDLQEQLTLRLASKYEKELDNELTAKQVLLLELIRAGESSPKRLADHMEVTPSAISQLISKLEEKGYIRRQISRENRREIVLDIAKKGEAYFQKAQRLEQKMNEQVYGKLSLKDLQQLKEILEKLHQIVWEE